MIGKFGCIFSPSNFIADQDTDVTILTVNPGRSALSVDALKPPIISDNHFLGATMSSSLFCRYYPRLSDSAGIHILDNYGFPPRSGFKKPFLEN